jgi:hypothetical protein
VGRRAASPRRNPPSRHLPRVDARDLCVSVSNLNRDGSLRGIAQGRAA